MILVFSQQPIPTTECSLGVKLLYLDLPKTCHPWPFYEALCDYDGKFKVQRYVSTSPSWPHEKSLLRLRDLVALVLSVTTDKVTIPPIEMDVAKIACNLSLMRHARTVLSCMLDLQAFLDLVLSEWARLRPTQRLTISKSASQGRHARDCLSVTSRVPTDWSTTCHLVLFPWQFLVACYNKTSSNVLRCYIVSFLDKPGPIVTTSTNPPIIQCTPSPGASKHTAAQARFKSPSLAKRPVATLLFHYL